jgi:hypothetical protein
MEVLMALFSKICPPVVLNAEWDGLKQIQIKSEKQEGQIGEGF